MITIIAIFNVKEECIAKFQEIAQECIAASRQEEGNEDYHLYTGKDDKTKFVFVETWKDADAIAFHNETPHLQKFAAAFGPLVSSAPIIEQITLLD